MMKRQLIFNTPEALQWRARLNALRYSCGCKTGMVTLLLCVIICTCYFSYAGGVSYSSQKKILITCGISFAGAVTGKIMGILFSRYKYTMLKRKLIRQGIL